jgi:hypothetical protein
MKVEQYNLGEGQIYIHGLGSFSNGTYEISDEDAENFRTVNMIDTGGFDNDPESPTFGSYIPNHQPGPDLVTASKSMHGITITPSSRTGSGTMPDAEPVGSLSSEGAPANSGGSE